MPAANGRGARNAALISAMRQLFRNRWVNLAGKAFISASVLYLSLRHTNLSAVAERMGALHASTLVAVIAICLLQNALVSFRWSRIVFHLGGHLSFWRAFCIVEIASFFGQILPATIGGDAIRGVQAWQAGVTLPQAVSSIVFDRAFGVAGIALAGLFGLPFVSRHLGQFAIEVLMIGFAIGVLALAALLSGPLWTRILPIRVGDPVRRFLADATGLMARPTVLLEIAAPSLAIQFLSTLVVFVALKDMGVEVSFAECVLSVTLGLLVAVLPISIAGWGIREGALVFALGAVGVPAESAFVSSLVMGLGVMAVALPGAAILLFYRTKRDQARE